MIRIAGDHEQIVNKTFVKIMDDPGHDAELAYKKKTADRGCGKSGFDRESGTAYENDHNGNKAEE